MPRFDFGSDLVQLVHAREDKVQNLLISHEGAGKSELSSIMQEAQATYVSKPDFTTATLAVVMQRERETDEDALEAACLRRNQAKANELHDMWTSTCRLWLVCSAQAYATSV